MPLSRTGGLALLVSLVVHGLAAALLYGLPGPQRAKSELLRFDVVGEADQAGTAFLVSKETGVMAIPEVSIKAKALVPQGESAKAGTPADPRPAKAGTPAGRGQMTAGNQPAGYHPGSNGSQRTGAEGQEIPAGASTTFFQVPARGLTIVYLIDSSASMGPNGALAAARRELLASLKRLPPMARFQVIVYNRLASPLLPGWPGWLVPNAKFLDDVEGALNDLQAEGGTDHERALYRALAMQPDVVYFLTDADDLPAGLPEETARRNQGRTTIHAIELKTETTSREAGHLRILAQTNGGTYQVVKLSQP